MNNSINIMKLLFYGYLGLILYLYVKEVPDLNTPESLPNKHMHFIVFFILGLWPLKNGDNLNFYFIIVSSIFDIGVISTAVPEKNASSLSSKSS